MRATSILLAAVAVVAGGPFSSCRFVTSGEGSAVARPTGNAGAAGDVGAAGSGGSAAGDDGAGGSPSGGAAGSSDDAGGAGSPSSAGAAGGDSGAGGVNATAGAAGVAGATGGVGGGGPTLGCGPALPCDAASSPCATTDALGCALECECAEDGWSCSSSCCAAPAVSGKTCSVVGAQCRDDCNLACVCDGGTWSCSAPSCGACPENLPETSDPCSSSAGTSCSYAASDGSMLTTCSCVSASADANVWMCGAAGTGGMGGASGAGGAAQCTPNGACDLSVGTCDFIDAAACDNHCTCSEGRWSCESACCVAPAARGKTCAAESATCAGACGDQCTCTSGLWVCPSACTQCPAPDPTPATGDTCFLDIGASCAYTRADGTALSCTCTSDDATRNRWHCTP